jgi:NADPH2:quinone reductase
VIEKTIIPFPTIGPGDVLIKVCLLWNSGSSYLIVLVQVEACGVNFIDTYFRCEFIWSLVRVTSALRLPTRQGLYKLKAYPAILGKETAGVVVALPTDETVLNDGTYKNKGFKIGGKVASVRICLTF